MRARWLCMVLTLSALVVGCQRTEQPPEPKVLAEPPTVTDIQPDNATPRGLRTAHVIGEGFDTKSPVEVYFGNTKAARVAIVSKTKIQVEVPPGKDQTEVEVKVIEKGHKPAIVPIKFKYFEQQAGDGQSDE